jgi:hypothetical protein
MGFLVDKAALGQVNSNNMFYHFRGGGIKEVISPLQE